MNSVAECQNYAEILGVIPAFATCTPEVLEDFARHGVFKQSGAGQTLCFQTHSDQNLYVLVSGSALLDAGDGILVALEPGDYFGRNPGRHHHHELIASVVATSPVEVLVVRPQEVLQLQQASARHRHPSKIEWRTDLVGQMPRFARRRPRRVALNSVS